MQKTCTLLLLVCSQLCFAQGYVPFPDSNAMWTGYRTDIACSNNLNNICYTNQFTLNGDTTIGSYTYTKVFETGYFINAGFPQHQTYFQGYHGALRNDIPAKKVYFVKYGTTLDTLLYDFDLALGDTIAPSYIYSTSAHPYPCVVSAIDSIGAWGDYRKRYTIHHAGSGDLTYFIEGIGSTAGLFEPFYRPEGMAELLCFVQNDTLHYPEGSTVTAICDPIQIPGCSDTVNITSSGPLIICMGDTLTLSAESGYDQYLWSTGATTQSIEAYQTGDYAVSALLDTCWLDSDTMEIYVSDPSPVITVTCYDYTASPGFESYQWYFNDEPVLVNGNFQTYHSDEEGYYYVVVTNEYGCTGVSQTYELSCCWEGPPCDLAVEIYSVNAIDIYPNPVSNYITIEFPPDAYIKNAELSILNITGQVLLQSSINNPKSTIDVSGFSKGVYFFRVISNGVASMKKIIIE